MAKSEKNLAFAPMLDIYGALLGQNQRTALDLYYNEDQSLSEIAESLAITRQGARDAIIKGERELMRLDEALRLRLHYEILTDLAEDADTPATIKTAIAKIIGN